MTKTANKEPESLGKHWVSAHPFGGKSKTKKTDEYYNKPIETIGLDELQDLQQKKLKKQTRRYCFID